MRSATLFCALFACTTSHAAEPPPNIVLLLADDLGYGELGCQGNLQIPTPHIDSIAASGIRFTNGYVTGAYCSVSRAGLMTGRYPMRFGYEFNPIGAQNEDPDAGLPILERTIARHLHDVGYTNALIGKWHLGGHAKYHPIRRGFDEFFGFTHEGHFFVPPPWRGATTWLRRRALPGGKRGRFTSADGKLIYSTHMGHDEPSYDANNPVVRGGQPVVETEYLTDAFTREAVDFIGRHRDKPFFLYLAYNAVHSPLQGADAYMKRFAHIEDVQRRIFAAMLANLDDSVGAVLKKLRDTGLERRTLVVFLSDNGGPTRELTSSNLPLRGGKGTVYEGGIRVPFLMQWKGVLPEGKTYDHPVISLDLFATVAAATGARAARAADGVDLLPFLRGDVKGRPHDVLFWRMGKRTAVRVGDWKLLRNPGRDSGGEWQLYDLAEDVAETKNLASTRRDKVESLSEVWKGMNSQMSEPFWISRR
jgi:arylsulfatase B